jgi:dolichyl-phosphate-mannose--protein O-mannosyl transferase
MTADGVRVGSGDANLWFWVLALAAGALAASKWNGLFDFFVVWLVVAAVVAQRYLPRLFAALDWPVQATTARWGNPRGFSLDLTIAAMLFVAATVYVLSYVPFFSIGKTLGDAVRLQSQMYGYHHGLVATHPYSSQWWQWPILQIPISYYYTDFRVGPDTTRETACCVAEILALPNPLTWLAGLVTVPLVAWLGWRERRKGYLLLVVAYFIQWLPWIGSPRIAFEYHFYPNLAIILLCDAIVLQRIWNWAGAAGRVSWPRIAVGGYLAAVFVAFWFWYPVTAGTHITWQAWNVRMITPLTGANWINPHPGQ